MRPKIAIPVAADELAKPNARAKYRNAIEQAGGEPVLIAPPQYMASVPDMIERFDGVLLPGGADVAPEVYGGREHPAVVPAPPSVDAFQIELVRAARRSRTPLLGICRGIQVMNVALGGTLYEDIDDQYAAPNGMRLRHQQTPDLARDVTSHRIEVTAGSALASLVSLMLSLLAREQPGVSRGLAGVASVPREILEARSHHQFRPDPRHHGELVRARLVAALHLDGELNHAHVGIAAFRDQRPLHQ